MLNNPKEKKLFMLLLGCKPPGRHTEQHDVLFAIGHKPKDLIGQIKEFWPEAKDRIHIDAWRQVTVVDGHQITVVEKNEGEEKADHVNKVFFINLGGYQENQFDEQHYIVLSVSNNSSGAIKKAKQTLFFKHNQFPGATSHIDDKYGIDVDDFYNIEDILLPSIKEKYTLQITQAVDLPEDEMHLGYFKLDKLV